MKTCIWCCRYGPFKEDLNPQGYITSVASNVAVYESGDELAKLLVISSDNVGDFPLLRLMLERLSRFGYQLPEQIKVHWDAGYGSHKTRDLLAEFGCDWEISSKGEPLQGGVSWVVERANSWHNRGFKELAIRTERKATVIEAMISLANSIIVIHGLIRQAWVTHRRDSRSNRKS